MYDRAVHLRIQNYKIEVDAVKYLQNVRSQKTRNNRKALKFSKRLKMKHIFINRCGGIDNNKRCQLVRKCNHQPLTPSPQFITPRDIDLSLLFRLFFFHSLDTPFLLLPPYHLQGH